MRKESFTRASGRLVGRFEEQSVRERVKSVSEQSAGETLLDQT